MSDIDPHEPLLRSSYYTPAQLVALGRISELSALLETLLRQVLEQVMGISSSAGEALFLGDRASTLNARIQDLARLANAPTWFAQEAAGWAKRVEKAIQKRDNILHRSPVIMTRDDNDEERVVGWRRARRTHRPEPIDNRRLLEVIEGLSKLQDEAMRNLLWGKWDTSFDGRSVS